MIRRFLIRSPALAFLFVLIVGAAPPVSPDDFYEQQFRAAKTDFQANRMSVAADEFRIAAFGFLDRPPLLSEALARLAVVQNNLNRRTDLTRTLERFVDVEQQFGAYSSVQLEPQVRTSFETLLREQVPRATLLGMPALRKLTNYEIQRISALPEGKRLAAYQAGAQAEPKNPEWALALARDYAARDRADDTLRWTAKVLELEPDNREARVLAAHARVLKRDCRGAFDLLTDADLKTVPDGYADRTVCLAEGGRWSEAQSALANVPQRLKDRADVRRAAQLISRNATAAASQPQASASVKTSPTQTTTAAPFTITNPADMIEQARRLNHDGKFAESFRRLSAAVNSYPSSRPLRLALLEAAVLSKSWQTAASQVPAITPLVTGEELYMFYASVALYETGQRSQARPLMERARPRMVPTPMVEYYVKAILGEHG